MAPQLIDPTNTAAQDPSSIVPAEQSLLSDWITYPYEENVQKFTVVQRKHLPKVSDLSKDGPFDSMNRNGRFIVPINYFRDVVLVPSMTAEMFVKQRAEVRYRPGDIVIATFPRSGTTWTEQIVLLMLNKGDPTTLNTKDKNSYYKTEPNRMGKVFADALYHEDPTSNIAAPWGVTCGMDLTLTAKDLDEIPFRRVFKTHHMAHMIIGMGEAQEALDKQEIPPFAVPGVKFLWVTRDPRDVALSMMRINTTNYEKHGFPVPAFMKVFLEGKVNRGCWKRHTREWLQCSEMHPEAVLPLTYEENKSNPLETARRIAQFLDIELTEQQLQDCVTHSSFSSMKKMSEGAEAEHVHQGRVGGWRDRLGDDVVEAFDNMLDDPSIGRYGPMYKTTTSKNQ